MWILTETDAILNTDNITYMDIEETGDDVFIKAYFTVSSASVWSDRMYTVYYKFCILDNTKNNKENVKRIFNEIFDSMYSGQKTFNIPKRLLGKN